MLLTSEKGTRKGKAVLGAVASISPLLGFLIAFFAVLGLACIGIGIGLVSVVIGHRRIRRPTPGKLFQPYSDEKVTCLASDTLDSLKVKLFTDSLSALGLSSGLTPPPLFFVRFAEGGDPLALAYVADMAHLSFRESEFQEDVGIHTEFKIEQPALVITEQLLEADLTAQEIESIVAVLIAKVQLDPFNSLRYEAVREVGFVD